MSRIILQIRQIFDNLWHHLLLIFVNLNIFFNSSQSLYAAFFCAWLVRVVDSPYSNCPKVSVSVVTSSKNPQRPGSRFHEFLGTRLPRETVPSFLRAGTNNQRPLDAGGKKRFSRRTGKWGFFLFLFNVFFS